MQKHLGGCRAAGGEEPLKSEGGGSELQRAGVMLGKGGRKFRPPIFCLDLLCAHV